MRLLLLFAWHNICVRVCFRRTGRATGAFQSVRNGTILHTHTHTHQQHAWQQPGIVVISLWPRIHQRMHRSSFFLTQHNQHCWCVLPRTRTRERETQRERRRKKSAHRRMGGWVDGSSRAKPSQAKPSQAKQQRTMVVQCSSRAPATATTAGVRAI
jgi:hypothetical protein